MRLERAIALLKLSSDYDRLGAGARNYQERVRAREELLQLAKVNYRRLAFDAHPDRGGSPKAMQKLNAAYDLLQRMEVAPDPPPVGVSLRVVLQHMQPFVDFNMSSGTTTSTSATMGYGNIRVWRY